MGYCVALLLLLLAWPVLTCRTSWYWDSGKTLHNSKSEKGGGRRLFEFSKQDIRKYVWVSRLDVFVSTVLAAVVISRTVNTRCSQTLNHGLRGLTR